MQWKEKDLISNELKEEHVPTSSKVFRIIENFRRYIEFQTNVNRDIILPTNKI